jgi:hypothetical protein
VFKQVTCFNDNGERLHRQAETMRDARGARGLSFLLTSTLVLIMFHPIALAEAAYDDDGWLQTSYGTDRLDLGDEFGCYGMPGLSWFNDPGAVAQSCRSYITERINASQWGAHPLSTYTPASLTMAQHERIASQGFAVHGDENELTNTAWHNSTDVPYDIWDWYNLGRRGGSLEKGLASLETIQEEVSEGGLVNLYWIGRVNDATVRHDREVLTYLNDADDIWLTTWGEAWSYWSAHRCYDPSISSETTDEGTVLRFESLISEACTSGDLVGWNLPLTWRLNTSSAEVSKVLISGDNASSIEGETNSMEGWWQQEDGVVLLSVRNGEPVELHFNDSEIEFDILGLTEFWNNHSSAVTIAGHETSDLFKWSKRFLEDDNVRFTWLLTPRTSAEGAAWMPYAVLGIAFASTVGMMAVLGREGIGPLGPYFGANSKQLKQQYSEQMKRSLDAEE